MARNRKNTKKKQNRIRSVAKPSAALLALLLLLGGGTVGRAATEIGYSPTWNVSGASGDISYTAGSVPTITTTGSNTGGGLQALEITVTSGDSNGRQLIITGNTRFNNTATINGYDVNGTPLYARVDINSGVTMTVVNGTTLTNTSQLNINGTHAGDITVMGIDSHVNLAGTQQGNVTLYGYDAVNSTLASATGGAGTPTVTGNVNVRIGQVQVENANMHIQGNLELYGHLYASSVIVNNKNLQLDGNLDVGQNALGTGTADHSGSVTIENGGSLTMLPGSSVNLKGETSGNPAILQLDGRLATVTANVGTLTVGTGSTYGALYVNGGTGSGGARLNAQSLSVGAGSTGYVYNKGVLEVVGSLGALNGTLAVRDNGQIITHNASLSETSISGQGGTGLSLWNNGTWTDTGTITVKASAGAADVASQGIITAQALKATDAGGVTAAALALSTASGSQVVNLSGDGSGNFLVATGTTVAANNTLNLSGVGGTASGSLTVSGGTVNAGKGVWNFTDTGTGLAVTGGTVTVGDAAKPAELSTLGVGKAALSGSGVVTVNANGTLNDSGSLSLANTSQLQVSGGTATITGAASTAGTAKITVDSNGSFSAASLTAASPSGVVLNTGTLTTGSVTSSADKGLTVNGGTASLGAVTSTAGNGVYLNGGASTATSVNTSAAGGLNVLAGTLTTNTLSSTTAGGATVSGGVLTVKNNLDLGAAGAVLVNGTGHLTLQPASTVTGVGSITMNSANATVEGAWGTLLVSSDGSNKSGTFTHEKGFLNLSQGTLLLTGLPTFTLDDLAAARKNVGGTDIGSSLLIASNGTFDSSGTKLDSIDTNFTDFALLNGGLFDTSLVNAKTDGTNITINGGGAGNQNVGFKDVDLKTGGLLISQNSALTVIKDIANAGAGKLITLDQGTLTLGNPGMSNSGGTISTGITTTASTGNALNVTNGTFGVTGSVGHDPGGTLAVTVDKGTLNVSQTVNATTLDVVNGGALNATGSITAGSLTDGTTLGKVDKGTITTQADMTVTSNGIDAVNGASIGVAGTLTVGSGGAVVAAGGSSINAGTLAATGNITATGTGSHIGVTNDYVVNPTATLTAAQGGDVNFKGNLSVTTPLTVNGGTLEVGKNLSLNGQGLNADNSGAITVGGAVSNAGIVLADHGAAITATGSLGTSAVTAQNGGDITAGSLTATGPVLVSGTGSTLTVASGLSASNTGALTVQDNALVSAGSISLVSNILADTNGSLTSKGNVSNNGNVTASNGGDIAITGTLSTKGDISVSGTGSTLNVSTAVDTPGNIAASAGGTAHLGSVTKAVDMTANGTGSAVTVTGDATNSGITKAYNNGTISVGGNVQSAGGLTADAGILNISGNITTPGNALSTNNGMIHGQSLTAQNVSATLGGDIMLDKTLTAHGTVLVDGAGSTLGAAQGVAVDGSLTVSNKGKADVMSDSSAQGVTVSSGGTLDVTGQLSSTGSVNVGGAGSTLTVTGALSATGQDLSVTGGAQAEAGSVTAKNVTVSGSGGSPATASTLLAHGSVTATGNVLVDGGVLTLDNAGTLGVTGSLTGQNGAVISVAGAASAASVSLDKSQMTVSGPLTDSGNLVLTGSSQFTVDGGAANIIGSTSTADTARLTVNNGGSFSTAGLTVASPGGAVLNSGTLTTGSVLSSADKGLTVNGGTASLGAVTSTAANGVYLNGGASTATSVSSSAAGGLTMLAGTLTTNTLSSTTASGATVSGGVLTVKNNLDLGAAGAVLVNGTGHLTLQPASTVTGTGSITMNSANATVEGAWGTLITSSDGSNKSGTFTHENAFLNLTKGTLLLTGLSTYTLDDLAAARKNASNVDMGPSLLIASTGTFESSGTKLTTIGTDFPQFALLNNGFFDTSLVNAKTDGTDVTINGGGAGSQNVGFKDVDLNSGGLTISKDSALTVIKDIADAGPGKAITLDKGTLTLGNPSMSNSGGSISTGITTTASTGNALNVVNGTFAVAGSVGHNPGGTLDVTVDKGTLNVSQTVDATTLAVMEGGALSATGSITAGSLSDGTHPGVLDKGSISTKGDMTVASNGVDAVNGSDVNVAGTLTVGNGGAVVAAGGSTIDAGTLAATGNITATGTGSHVGVSGNYVAAPTATLTATKGGDLNFKGNLSVTTPLAVDAGTLEVGKNLTLSGQGLSADNGGAITVGGAVSNAGNVLADHGAAITATGSLAAAAVTAQNGGDITAGSLTATGPVLVSGAGSTLSVTAALNATGQDLSVTGGARAEAGSVAAKNVTVSGAGGSPVAASTLLAHGNVTASGNVLVDGGVLTLDNAGSLGVTGSLSGQNGAVISVAGAASAASVSLDKSQMTVSGPLTDSGDLTLTGDSQLKVNGGTATITGATSTADTAKLTVDNKSSFSTGSLTAASPSGVVLNSGTLTTGSVQSSADKGLTVNGGTASLGTVTSTADNGVYLNGGASTATSVSSSATGGLTMLAGTLTTNTLSSTTANGATVGGGLLTVKNSLDLGAAGAVLVNGTGHLTLQPAATVSGAGSITMNSPNATVEGAWGTLITSSDGSNKSGTFTHENAFLNLTKGTLLLTGLSTYSLGDLAAARKNASDVDMGPNLLIASTGTLQTSGSTVDTINTDFPDFASLNNGLFDISLVNAKTDGTDVTINGGGAGNQNVGFKNVDLNSGGLTISKDSALTVITSITDAGPGKTITLDQGSLTLGNPSMSNSGGSISTGITTTASTGNALNVTNGTFALTGSVGHDPGGTLDVTVDKGTLNVSQTVDATTLAVTGGGALNATGSITAGSLSDGIHPGVLDKGTISTKADMTVTNNGIDAVNGASIDVAGTLTVGNGGSGGAVVAAGGSTIDAGILAATGDITATGTGSHVGVSGDYVAAPTATLTANKGGDLNFKGNLSVTTPLAVDAGTLEVGKNLTLSGQGLNAENGGAITVGGAVSNAGNVLADHGGAITVTGSLGGGAVSAQNGGDITAGSLVATGPVYADGAGSTLSVTAALNAAGQDMHVTGGAKAEAGSITAKNVTVSGAGGSPATASTLLAHGTVTASGNVLVDGGVLTLDNSKSTLGVTGSLSGQNGAVISVAGAASAASVSLDKSQMNLSGSLNDSGDLVLTGDSQFKVNGGTATITGTTSTADTAKLTVDNKGSFSTGSLTAGSPGGVVLNSGSLSTGSVLSTADKGLSINGGTASLGTVTSTAANGVYLAGGASTATAVSSSAAGGLNMQGGTLSTNSLSSTAANGVTVGGGVLTVKNSLTLGAASAVLVNGTGHLTLQPSVTLSGAGSITMNSATATVEGAWAKLIASSDGSFKSGSFTHENAFLNLTKGTLLLTGLSTYTLNDLSMARKNVSDVDMGPGLLIASTGTLQSSGTPVDTISTDSPGFGSLNNGLFDVSLVNAKTDGTDVTINGGGAGNQNVGFKDVDLNSGGLTISKNSALTVITSITNAGPGKVITLDTGTLTLGNPGMSNSGGNISTGITTSASTGNALNVTNGTFDVTGSVGHDPAGTLDVTVDKGTLNVSQTVDATTLTVSNKGALNATGALTTGSLTAQSGGDVTAPSLTATGPVLVDGAGSTLAVSGAVSAPGQHVSVTGGAQGQMGSLTAQDVSVSGAGGTPAVPSSLQVQGDATASGQVSVDTGSLSLGGSLSAGGDVNLSKAGSLTAGKNVTATGDVNLATGSSLTAGKNVTATGDVNLATGSSLNAGGQLTATGLTATGASTVTAASATVSGPLRLGGGSSLTASGNFATSGTGQTVTVGAATDTTGSSLTAGSHTGGNAAAYFVASGAAGSPSSLHFGSVGSPLNDSLVAGPNSLVSIGPRNLLWVSDQVTASGVTPSATLALSAPTSLGSTGQWLAGEKYTAGGQWNGAATADNYGLALRGSSLLITDLSTAGASPLLTLGGKNTALVEPGASIRVYGDKLQAGQSYALLGGLSTDKGLTQNGSTWLTNGQALQLQSLSSSNALITVESVTLAGDRLLFNTKPVDAGQTLPGVSDSLADYLNKMALHFGFDTQSSNAGVRFLSRALDTRFGGGDLGHASRVIEGAQQLAVAGGVPASTLSAVQGTVGAFSGRTSLASPLMRPKAGMNGMAGLHLEEDGSVSPDDGLSGGADDTLRNGVAVWAMPIYQHNSVSGMSAGTMSTGFTSNLGGMALGADYTFDNAFRLGVALGLGGGYAKSNGDFNQTDNSFNFWSAHVYGGWNVRDFGLTADVGYSGSYNKVQQRMDSNMGMPNLNSDVNSSAFSAGLRGEYKFETSLLDIIPHVGVRYTGLTVDGYDVKSGGTVFAVESNTQNIWTFPLGVTFSKSLESASGWVFRPQLDVGITPAAGDVKARSRVRVPGVDGATSLQSQVVDYMSYDAGLGFEVQKGALTLGINYQIQASEHRTAQGVFGMFRYEF